MIATTYTLNNGRVLDLTTHEGLHDLRYVIAYRLGIAVQKGANGIPDYLWYSPFYPNKEGGGGVTLDIVKPLPNWPRNAEDALSLITDDVQLTLWHNHAPDHSSVILSWIVDGQRVEVGSVASTTALAICLAWLTMKDSQA